MCQWRCSDYHFLCYSNGLFHCSYESLLYYWKHSVVLSYGIYRHSGPSALLPAVNRDVLSHPGPRMGRDREVETADGGKPGREGTGKPNLGMGWARILL